MTGFLLVMNFAFLQQGNAETAQANWRQQGSKQATRRMVSA